MKALFVLNQLQRGLMESSRNMAGCSDLQAKTLEINWFRLNMTILRCIRPVTFPTNKNWKSHFRQNIKKYKKYIIFHISGSAGRARHKSDDGDPDQNCESEQLILTILSNNIVGTIDIDNIVKQYCWNNWYWQYCQTLALICSLLFGILRFGPLIIIKISILIKRNHPDFLGERDNPKDKAPWVQRRHPQKRHRSFPPGSASEFGNFINLWRKKQSKYQLTRWRLTILTNIFRWTQISMCLSVCQPKGRIMRGWRPGSLGKPRIQQHNCRVCKFSLWTVHSSYIEY